MQHRTKKKLGVGSALACGGAIAILLVTLLDPQIGRPWAFLIGFALGLTTTLGAGLCLSGLVERRRAGAVR